MGKSGMVNGGLTQANPVTDPLQARWLEVTQMIRELTKEKASLREQMRHGICEVCGAPFTRTTAKKRYCSQQCNVRLYHRNRIGIRFDVDLLHEMLPVLTASGQMSDRNLDIIRMVVLDGVKPVECADREGLTRERVGQILGRATSLCRTLKLIQSRIETATQPLSEASGSIPSAAQK